MKKNQLLTAMFLGAVLVGQTFPQDSPAKSPAPVFLTLYSLRGTAKLLWPGRKSWAGRLWVDHQKIGIVLPGHFLTLKLAEGDHSLAGQSGFAHESTIQTVIRLHDGEHYFMRLIVNSKTIDGFGPTRDIAEPVTCQDASHEAAASEPIKLKHIEKSFVEQVVRESYFPECGK